MFAHSRLFAVLVLLLTVALARGGEITLKNGMVLSGQRVIPLISLDNGPNNAPQGPVTNYPILMAMDDLQMYFVPRLQVAEVNKEPGLDLLESFSIPPEFRGRSRTIEEIRGIEVTEAFDRFGRRPVTLHTSKGPFTAIQGITKINARVATIAGLNCLWETGVATTSIPADQVDTILRNITKAENPDQRLAITRFYIQAGRFQKALDEITAIESQFPVLAGRCVEVRATLMQEQAQVILAELKLRAAGGQHRLAYQYARQFPRADVAASILKQVDDFVAEYDTKKLTAEAAVTLMNDLQAALNDKALESEVAPFRALIGEQLNIDTFPRLDAFLKLAAADNLSAGEKLALALSGWVVGSNNAVTDLRQAISYWKASFLVREYLQTPDDSESRRLRLLEQITTLEGLSPRVIAQMVPQLPAFRESQISPGVITTLTTRPDGDDQQAAYDVVLPPEYSPNRSYPLIVALHNQGLDPPREIHFWAGTAESPGQAARHGYIVIAPHFVPLETRRYEYGSAAHEIVFGAINDARRRFAIDSDRIFLVGHGLGGDAVFDIGFSHPYEFAGIIAISGMGDKICRWYWDNAKPLPTYVVSGERDDQTAGPNATILMRMIRANHNVIFTKYVGCGPEPFSAEIHKFMSWMKLQRRVRFPKEVEFHTLRDTDNVQAWFQYSGLPAVVTKANWSEGRGKGVNPLKVSAHVTAGNSIRVSCRTDRCSLFLSPEFVDFEKRVPIDVNGKQRQNEFLKPDARVMLDELRLRGDRQRLYWTALSFD